MTKEYCTCFRLTKGLFSNKYLTVSFFEKLNPKRLKGDEKLPLFIKCHISITVWFKGKVLQYMQPLFYLVKQTPLGFL